MKVEETGRRTNCLQPGPILMVMFRMLSGGRVATRLLATRPLLHVVGLIGRRAIATAAIFGAPIRRGLAMIGMDGIGGLRGTRSEERRVGKGCVSTGRSRWAPYP